MYMRRNIMKIGNLLKEGALKDNKRHGIWKSYYRDGTKWSEGEFINGKMEGSTTTYYSNGQIRYTGLFEQWIEIRRMEVL